MRNQKNFRNPKRLVANGTLLCCISLYFGGFCPLLSCEGIRMLSACIYDPMEKMGWSPEYIAYAAKHEGKKLLGGSKQWQTALTPEQQEIKAAELKERLPGLTKAQLLQRLGPPDVQYNYHSASGEMMEWKTVNDTDESMLWDIGGSASVCAFMKHGVCGGTGIWPQVYGR